MSDYDPFTMAPGTAEMVQQEAAVFFSQALGAPEPAERSAASGAPRQQQR